MTTEKTRYSDKELKEFEAIIDEKIKQAEEQLEFYKQELLELNESDDSKVIGPEHASGSAESERLNTMIGRQRKFISHLKNAKIRIQNKAYGICRVTGKLISKERLKAVPHATLSIEAKKMQDK